MEILLNITTDWYFYSLELSELQLVLENPMEKKMEYKMGTGVMMALIDRDCA